MPYLVLIDQKNPEVTTLYNVKMVQTQQQFWSYGSLKLSGNVTRFKNDYL